MTITPTDLRKNLFKLLDEVVSTGKTLEINRNGTILKIIPPKKISKFDKLKKHNTMTCSPEDIIENNWEKEWVDDLS